MGDHALFIYPPHGHERTNHVDNAESFTFYEINLHLHFVSIKSETLWLSDIYPNKCKKNCSLSTTYNGEMTHQKKQK